MRASGLIRRRVSLRRDPVTPETHALVLARDRGCLQAKMEPRHVCRDQWGNPHRPDDFARLQLDHVKDAPMMGRRAPSDPAHLVSLCAEAHLGGWATSHRPELRAYLRAVSEPEHVHVRSHRRPRPPGCDQPEPR